MKLSILILVFATMALAWIPTAEADSRSRFGCVVSGLIELRPPNVHDAMGVRCEETDTAVPDLGSDASGDDDIYITRPYICAGTPTFQC